MPRKPQATIVEDFDDDTDLPLPSRPLPNTGTKGALIKSVDSDDSDPESDDDDDELSAARHPGPASPSQLSPGFGAQSPQQLNPTVSDLTPYKKWTCIYPIYIDAKRSYGCGSRRIARTKSVWWPLSKDIADATVRLGLGTLHEVQKCHPSDWVNPGRVRVQWKRDGKLVNERIKTKKQLLEAIAFYIQSVKPELIPKPPFDTARTTTEAEQATPSKQPLTTKTKSGSGTKKGGGKKDKAQTTQPHLRRALPSPPEPIPPFASRVSAYSPASTTGMFIDTLRAGMSAAAAENAAAPPGMSGKGKRKVVRVRG